MAVQTSILPPLIIEIVHFGGIETTMYSYKIAKQEKFTPNFHLGSTQNSEKNWSASLSDNKNRPSWTAGKSSSQWTNSMYKCGRLCETVNMMVILERKRDCCGMKTVVILLYIV